MNDIIKAIDIVCLASETNDYRDYEVAIIGEKDGENYYFYDYPDGSIPESEIYGYIKDIDSTYYHPCIKSALYDDMTGYVDEVRENDECLPDTERYIVNYFKYNNGDLEQLTDFNITKEEIIANIKAQKYVEGANYYFMKDFVERN